MAQQHQPQDIGGTDEENNNNYNEENELSWRELQLQHADSTSTIASTSVVRDPLMGSGYIQLQDPIFQDNDDSNNNNNDYYDPHPQQQTEDSWETSSLATATNSIRGFFARLTNSQRSNPRQPKLQQTPKRRTKASSSSPSKPTTHIPRTPPPSSNPSSPSPVPKTTTATTTASYGYNTYPTPIHTNNNNNNNNNSDTSTAPKSIMPDQENFPGEEDGLLNRNNGDDGEDEEGEPAKPSKNPCLHCLHFIQLVVVLDLLCILAAQILPLFFMTMPQIGRIQMVLRGYMTLFCLVFILVETRVPVPFLKESTLLTALMSRGFLYTFFGVVSLEESIAVNYRGQQLNQGSFYIGWPALFMEFTAYIICAIGVLYIAMGICCIGQLKRRMEDDLQDQWDDYRQSQRNLNRNNRSSSERGGGGGNRRRNK